MRDIEIFMVKSFKKWLQKQNINTDILIEIVKEIQDGLVDADLGNFLYKKRIPVHGKGKRGGARTLVAYKKNSRLFFLHGFAKNEKDNITNKEKIALIEYVNLYMGFSKQQLNNSMECRELIEVKPND